MKQKSMENKINKKCSQDTKVNMFFIIALFHSCGMYQVSQDPLWSIQICYMIFTPQIILRKTSNQPANHLLTPLYPFKLHSLQNKFNIILQVPDTEFSRNKSIQVVQSHENYQNILSLRTAKPTFSQLKHLLPCNKIRLLVCLWLFLRLEEYFAMADCHFQILS